MRLIPGWQRAGLVTLLAVTFATTAAAREEDRKVDSAQAHNNRGLVLQEQGRLDDAIVEWKKAIKLDPKLAIAHTRLGSALVDKGQPDEAIPEYKKAIELDPKDARPHTGLGNALRARGRLNEAIAEHKIAIELDPKYPLPHYNLGIYLHDLRRLDETLAEYKKAIELDPKFALAHFGLGCVLGEQEKFTQARQTMQRCLDLIPADHPLLPEVTQQLLQLEVARARFFQRILESSPVLDFSLITAPPPGIDVGIAAMLPAPPIAAERKAPVIPAEQVLFAKFCQSKKQFAHAVRCYIAAFTAGPKWADDLKSGYRYQAACLAVLAGAGKGEDAAKLDDKERARLRKQALDWLNADLTLWRKQIENGTLEQRSAAQKTLRHWQQDADLAALRDSAALDKLPEAERASCRKLWDEVSALLKK